MRHDLCFRKYSHTWRVYPAQHHPVAVAPGTMEREGKSKSVCHTIRLSETVTTYIYFAVVLRRIDPAFPRHGKTG